MGYQRRTSCTRCSGKAQSGTVALLAYIIDRFPETSSFGIYNCRSIAGSSTLSQHSCGRAADSRIPITSNGGAITSIGYPVIQFLDKYSTEFGIVEQIYNRVMYDASNPRGRYYGGVHPHRDHIHWTQTPTRASGLTYKDIVAIAGPAQGGEEEGAIDMLSITPNSSREDIRLLQHRLNGAFNLNLDRDGIYGEATAKAVRNTLLGFTGADPGDPEITKGEEVNALMWDALEVGYFQKALSVGGGGTVDSDARQDAAEAKVAATKAQTAANAANATAKESAAEAARANSRISGIKIPS